jgi:hypothetical protein
MLRFIIVMPFWILDFGAGFEDFQDFQDLVIPW